MSAIGASQKCCLRRLSSACGSKADLGKWSDPAINEEFTVLSYVASSNVFQGFSKFRLRSEAHGSISVQEGHPIFWGAGRCDLPFGKAARPNGCTNLRALVCNVRLPELGRVGSVGSPRSAIKQSAGCFMRHLIVMPGRHSTALSPAPWGGWVRGQEC